MPASKLVSLRVPPRTPSPGKPPLLVLLHGLGSNEEDLVGLSSHLDGRFLVRSVRAPNTMGRGQFAWFQFSVSPDGGRQIDSAQAESSRRALLAYLDEVVAADGADPQRVYLAGFSQGGIMALSIALSEPDRVAGVVAMSSRILPETAQNPAPSEKLAGLPILVVHGTQDQVLPIEHGRASKALLSKLPVALTYQEFPMPHTISDASLALVSSWLTARLDGPRRLLTDVRQ